MKVTSIFSLLSLLAVFGLTACSPQQEKPSSEQSQSSYEQAKQATQETATDAMEMGRETLEETGDFISDSAITARVKTALWDIESLRDSTINVETINGTVVLSGVTIDDDARELAEQIASGVEGVKNVENDIVIEQ